MYLPITHFLLDKDACKIADKPYKTCPLILCLHSPLFVLDTPRLAGSYHTADSYSAPQESHLRSLRAGHDGCIIISFTCHRHIRSYLILAALLYRSLDKSMSRRTRYSARKQK